VLTAEQLAHCMFPLGSTPSKAEVRAEAAERGFTLAQKPDSHDICFIPDGDTRGWLADKVGAEPGEILDRSGAVIGSHEGALAFTVGQRKGLNIGYPADDGRPRFVLEVRPKDNTVVVGPREALAVGELAGSTFSWAGRAPDAATTPFDVEVQVRAHADPVPAIARLAPHATTGAPELVIRPAEPIEGVAPGQTAVIYDGTRVIGQCTIDRTVSAAPVPV
jgi:tRNA-specific 2-thiouridylase